MTSMQIPKPYRVDSITQDTEDVFTITVEKRGNEPQFLPGQFNMIYQFGIGEAAISISGDPQDEKVLKHTIRAVGSVTNSLQKIQPGDEIGIRGPYGNGWPLSQKGCDVLVIAGGIGMAPLRPALMDIVARKSEYGTITLLYGSRTAQDILFKEDIQFWREQGVDIDVTVDTADLGWKGRVGVVTALIRRHVHRPKNTLVFICGPEIMMRFALHELLGAGVEESHIYLSMERNMQCAVGFCGHCLWGPHFICKNGPVFSYPQVKDYINIKEL